MIPAMETARGFVIGLYMAAALACYWFFFAQL
jgi:hypothetical protein